jgi:hypothetical protein
MPVRFSVACAVKRILTSQRPECCFDFGGAGELATPHLIQALQHIAEMGRIDRFWTVASRQVEHQPRNLVLFMFRQRLHRLKRPVEKLVHACNIGLSAMEGKRAAARRQVNTIGWRSPVDRSRAFHG